jgi:hypothetical protein
MTKTKYALAMLVAVLAFATPSYAALLTFDNSGTTSGTVTYSGSGSVTGAAINFDIFTVSGAPVNNGSFTCSTCVLTFTSGSNTDETLPVFEWGAGAANSVTITGTILEGATVRASGTLLSGSFTSMSGTFNTSTGQLSLVGLGTDTKDDEILSFWQVLNPGAMTSTNIAAQNCTPNGTTGAFTCTITEADVQNVNPNVVVPEPATLLLFGLGLAGAGRMTMRRRRS